MRGIALQRFAAALQVENRQRFRRSVAVAALVHAAVIGLLTQVQGPTRESVERAIRPLTVKFTIRRDPRVAKPFALRKAPQPKRQLLVRQAVEVEARGAQLWSSRSGGMSVRSLSAPQVRLGGEAELVSIDLGRRATDIGVSTAKEPESRIDMREQLLDLNFLDTGKYQAMVVQDPADKQKIQGYFHIAQAYSARMVERNIEASVRAGDVVIEMLQNPHGIQNLADALNEYTHIQTDITARLPLSSKELLEIPWVLIPPIQFTLTEGELENLGRYLVGGGFLLIDAGVCMGCDIDAFMRQMVKEALARVGQEARFFRLPNNHPLYHSFFDFDSPPRPIIMFNPFGSSGSGSPGEGRGNVDYMVGVEVEGRLAVVLSYQNLLFSWENAGYRNDKQLYGDNSRVLQFGINLVVFALTQEGSITNRVMQTVR